MPSLADMMGKPSTGGSLKDLMLKPSAQVDAPTDPLAQQGSYTESVFQNGAPGALAGFAKRLGPALVNSVAGVGPMMNRAAIGLLGTADQIPERQAELTRLSTPTKDQPGSLGISTLPPAGQDYASPASSPIDNLSLTNLLKAQAVPQVQNELQAAKESRDTQGFSALRDISLSGLLVSGAGTPYAAAALAGFPAVMEASGADAATKRLGENAGSAIKSFSPGSPVGEFIGDTTRDVIQQAPTVAALGLGLAATVGKGAVKPATAGATDAAVTAAPRDPLSLGQLLQAPTDVVGGVKTPGFQNWSLTALLDKVLPESLTSKFRGDLENLKRNAPDVGDAAQIRKETLNLTAKDAQGIADEIRNTMSEAEQKRLSQLMEGLPVRRLGQPTEALDPANTNAYNARYAKYLELAKLDVEINSPGLRPEFKATAAKAIAISRLYEDIGGQNTKSWFNYKPTNAEMAPLNKLEQDLRGAETGQPVSNADLPTFTEGAAQVRAAANKAGGVEPTTGLITSEPVTISRAPKGTIYDPAATKAIVDRFDPNNELHEGSTRQEALAAVRSILQRTYTERPGYVKHMYVDKMAEGLTNILESQKKGKSWGRGSGIKEDTAGFTQRQDPSLTQGLRRVQTAAEPVSRAIQENGALAAARNFNEALTHTDFIKNAPDGNVSANNIDASGWHLVGDSKANGALSGKWVSPQIWKQIGGTSTPSGVNANIQHLTDWWSRNNAVGKLAGNLMNFVGAHLANDMFLGIPLWEAPAVTVKGIGAYAGKYATDVKRLGTGTLSGADATAMKYMEAELAPVKAAADALVEANKPALSHATGIVDKTTSMMKGFLKYLMTEEGASVVDPKSMARFFNIVETINRNGTYVHLRDKGLTHEVARDMMNKAQVDYSDPSPVVQGMRNYGIGGVGNRFAQFGISQSKNLLGTAFNANPLIAARVWKYPALNEVWNNHVQQVNGETDKERKLRMDLHKVYDGFPASAFIYDMPRNAEGQVQTANFGRANPTGWATALLTGVNEELKGNSEGRKQIIASAGGLSPAIGPFINLMNRYDPFYGRDPLPDKTDILSPSGLGRATDYLAAKMLPEALGTVPAGAAQVGRMAQNAMNMGIRGKRVAPDELLVRDVLGVRVNHFNPQMEKYSRAQQIQGEIGASNLSSILKQDVTQPEAIDILKEHLRNARRLSGPFR